MATQTAEGVGKKLEEPIAKKSEIYRHFLLQGMVEPNEGMAGISKAREGNLGAKIPTSISSEWDLNVNDMSLWEVEVTLPSQSVRPNPLSPQEWMEVDKRAQIEPIFAGTQVYSLAQIPKLISLSPSQGKEEVETKSL